MAWGTGLSLSASDPCRNADRLSLTVFKSGPMVSAASIPKLEEIALRARRGLQTAEMEMSRRSHAWLKEMPRNDCQGERLEIFRRGHGADLCRRLRNRHGLRPGS